MKIFSTAQMKEADRVTIKKAEITSLELMERAATKVFQVIHQKMQGAPVPIHVFCGLGNNGGDGLVLSRLLLEHGYHVTTYIVNFSKQRSPEFLANYDLLKNKAPTWPIQLKSDEKLPEIKVTDMVIDAIFGIGLTRPLQPWVASLVRHINAANCFVLSVDIPSGLYMDKVPKADEAVIYASLVIAFQLPKLIFFLPETAKYIQDIEVIDIGLDSAYIQ